MHAGVRGDVAVIFAFLDVRGCLLTAYGDGVYLVFPSHAPEALKLERLACS